MKNYYLLSLVLLGNIGLAQTPEVSWDRYFGGQNGLASSIEKTADGGYIIAGNAQAEHEEAVNYGGTTDGFVVKTNAEFEREWSFCYGGEFGETIGKIIPVAAGGYLFVGQAANSYPESGSGSDGLDAWIVRINAQGGVIWEKKYGGSKEDKALGVAETSNGFIVTGYSRSSNYALTTNYGFSDYWTMKLDPDGNIVGNYVTGGNDNDQSASVVTLADGSFVVAGETQSEGGNVTCRASASICESDFWIVKYSPSGAIAWAKCIGSTYAGSNFFNRPSSIITTADDGFLIVGSGYDNDASMSFGLADFWAVKLSSDGNLQWRKVFGGSQADRATAVRQTADGGFIIAGTVLSADGQVTVDFEAFYMSSGENGWLVKLDADGNLQWQKAVGSDGAFGYDGLNDILEISEGEYVAVGRAGSSNHDCADSAGRKFWVLRLSSEGLSTPDNAARRISIYPNPTQNAFTIAADREISRVSIFDLSGRLIANPLPDANNRIDISGYQAGNYLVKVDCGGSVSHHKIVKR